MIEHGNPRSSTGSGRSRLLEVPAPRGSARVALIVGTGLLLAAAAGIIVVLSRARESTLDPPPREEASGEAFLPLTLPSGARSLPPRLADRLAQLDPGRDGWESERLGELVTEQLGNLAGLATRSEASPDHGFPGVAANELFRSTLRPRGTAPRSVPPFRVSFTRPGDEAEPGVNDPAATPPRSSSHGEAALRSMWEELLEPFAGGRAAGCELKLVSIEVEAAELVTRVIAHISGATPDGVLQQNARWLCRWTRPENGGLPLLLEIRPESHEEVLLGPGAGTFFEDRTEAVLGANDCYRRQLVPGFSHWNRSLDRLLGVELLGHEGLALGDANGDGLDDLYLCQTGGLPNRLFVRDADGSAVDVSADSGVDYLDRSRRALFLDLDHDGDQDLVVATGDLLFHENDGKGRFTLKGRVAAENVYSMAAADADGDGDLDLYACQYADSEVQSPVPYHDANNGVPNLMVRNDGDFRFVEVTREWGLDVNNRRYSFAAAWIDHDEDGDPDLYVANDFGRNNLYRNDGGRFEDVAAAAGVEDISAGMSVAWGDMDLDGRPDLHVSNMFSSAGNRVAFQRQFHGGSTPEARAAFQRHARGNSLFRNLGDGSFADVSIAAGITMGRWAWGSRFVDINNDGLEDLVVVNGFVTNDDPHDL